MADINDVADGLIPLRYLNDNLVCFLSFKKTRLCHNQHIAYSVIIRG